MVADLGPTRSILARVDDDRFPTAGDGACHHGGMAKGTPARAEVVWWNGLRWVEGAWMQLERFQDAFYEQQHALADARMRAALTDPKDGWRIAYDRDYGPYDPRRPIRVPTWALEMQSATELDLLIVAVRNVIRAQDRLPADIRTSMTGEDVLELLRNVNEHWDEEGGRSVEELKVAHPDVRLGEIRYTNKEIWVGGVPLSRILAWLARVREALKEALTTAGIEVPDDLDSAVDGDDALPWPEDRRRYRLWAVPHIDMEDWGPPPPEDMAGAVDDMLALRFLNLRRRDHAD